MSALAALAAALRKRYKSPQAALRALGLDETLAGGNTMPRRPSQHRPGFDEDPLPIEQMEPDMVVPCEQALDIVGKLISRVAPEQKDMFVRGLAELAAAHLPDEEGPVADQYPPEDDPYAALQPSGPDHWHDPLSGDPMTRPSTAPALGRRDPAMDSRSPTHVRFPMMRAIDTPDPIGPPRRRKAQATPYDRARIADQRDDFLARFPELRGR